MVAGSTANLLGVEEGRALVAIARQSLKQHLAGDRVPAPPPSISGALAEPRGVFVTLTNAGRLRGCTGYVEAIRAVGQAVHELATSSATRDHRFPPVTADELDQIHIEVSVLTPPHPIDPSEIVIGRHGLIARMHGRSGLLLPQVPVEWGWDREEFLRRTCEKAGLPPDSWTQRDCALLGFEAQIFEEE